VKLMLDFHGLLAYKMIWWGAHPLGLGPYSLLGCFDGSPCHRQQTYRSGVMLLTYLSIASIRGRANGVPTRDLPFRLQKSLKLPQFHYVNVNESSLELQVWLVFSD